MSAQNVGVGTDAPTVKLTVEGALRANYRLVTGTTALDNDDYYVHIGGATTYTVTLPDPSNVGGGTVLYLRTQYGTGTKTIGSTSGSQIRLMGAPTLLASFTIASPSHDGYQFLSDGTAWNQISGPGLGKRLMLTNHSFNEGDFRGGNTSRRWFPAGLDGPDDQGGLNYRSGMSAPYNGRLVKIVVRGQDNDNAPSLRNVRFFLWSGTTTDRQNHTPTYTSPTNFDMAVGGTISFVAPDNWYVNEGDAMGIGWFAENDGSGTGRIEDIDYHITAVWEYFVPED